MNIERKFNDIKENVVRTVGIGLVVLAPMVALDSGSASAQQEGPNGVSSEPAWIPEPGKSYTGIVNDSALLNPVNDELRTLVRGGFFVRGDCYKVTELENPNSDPLTYAEVFTHCDVAPIAPAPAVAPCVNLEVLLGTASGNGATSNEITVTGEVIVHGDAKINGEFRADSFGPSGLIEKVRATPANPAHIEVGNPAWGLDVAAFCNPADMDANVAQGVANLQSQGMRADVIDWPGPNELGVLVAAAPAVSSPETIQAGIETFHVDANTGYTVTSNDLANGRLVAFVGDVDLFNNGNKINPNKLNGSNSNIGTIVIVDKQNAAVNAQFGTQGFRVPRSQLRGFIAQQDADIKLNGCDNGCNGQQTFLDSGDRFDLLTEQMLSQLENGQNPF